MRHPAPPFTLISLALRLAFGDALTRARQAAPPPGPDAGVPLAVPGEYSALRCRTGR
ncbi:exported hypothetical protein [Nitrolancea hollandica Lb]|uniref:Uncharacterized protein n=1 Tax=Nitrolancea hollandica Lb TaxID=1129897 RepID=I4EFF5_9BACT|nr:exported hypothetical protein [Nitrolancea hollandica Lb]